MAVELAFFADLNTGQLYKTADYATAYTLPTLVQGDTVVLSIGLVSELPSSGPGRLSQVSPLTGYSCKVAIGTEGTTALTSVTLSESGGLLTGTLPMNTAAITSLFTGSETSTFTRTFELEFTDATGVLTLKRKITMVGELITSATTDTPGPDVNLGKAEAVNLYVAKAGCNGIVFLDQSGNGNDLFAYNDNGNMKFDPIT